MRLYRLPKGRERKAREKKIIGQKVREYRNEDSSADNSSGHILPSYTVYMLSKRQRWVILVLSGSLLYGIGYLFYHHALIALILAGGAMACPGPYSRFLLARRRATLSIQFKQALYSLSSSLAAGRSVENSFREAIQDLKLLSPEGENDLIREFGIIIARMEYGEPVEAALLDFARRAAMEDITNFADVFVTCKRTGGDLIEVMRRTSSVIGEKLEIQQDIRIMIAQKKFEAKAMFAAPFLFVLFMNLSAADYMEPLYGGTGRIISTLCLLVLGLCLIWMSRIVRIEV